MKSVTDDRKEKQGDRIQKEDGPERDGHFLFSSVHDWPNGGNRASAADGGARADQKRRYVLHLEQSSNCKTEEHGKAYAERGVCEPGPARAYNLVQVHSETQANYGCLQEECGQLLSIEVIRVGERHTVDQPGQECQRSRNEATSSDDKADKEDVLGVRQASVSLHR